LSLTRLIKIGVRHQRKKFRKFHASHHLSSKSAANRNDPFVNDFGPRSRAIFATCSAIIACTSFS